MSGDAGRWAQVKEVFQAALDQAPEQHRASSVRGAVMMPRCDTRLSRCSPRMRKPERLSSGRPSMP
jgi:hypothetical protein